MNKIYVIADTHFNHGNIIKYCGRPFKNESDMNESLIRRWNGTVTNSDIVIHLGDFAFHKDSKAIANYCKRLNGRKILVRGNHDRKSLSWYLNNGFDFVCDSFTIGDILFTHRPQPIKRFLLMPYKLNVHGHIHEKTILSKGLLHNVSVEVTDYYPINLDVILNKYKLKLKRKRRG